MARPDISRDVQLGLSLGLTPSQFDAIPRADRELLQAQQQVDTRVCSEHGGDLSECDQPVWYAQRSVCIPAMEQAAAAAFYDELHKDLPYHEGNFRLWRKERSHETPFHYLDGVRIWVSPEELDPEDDFLRKRPRDDEEAVTEWPSAENP